MKNVLCFAAFVVGSSMRAGDLDYETTADNFQKSLDFFAVKYAETTKAMDAYFDAGNKSLDKTSFVNMIAYQVSEGDFKNCKEYVALVDAVLDNNPRFKVKKGPNGGVSREKAPPPPVKVAVQAAPVVQEPSEEAEVSDEIPEAEVTES